jgi:hypothetical protein
MGTHLFSQTNENGDAFIFSNSPEDSGQAPKNGKWGRIYFLE